MGPSSPPKFVIRSQPFSERFYALFNHDGLVMLRTSHGEFIVNVQPETPINTNSNRFEGCF